jgi:TetR/AcrR family transcriptional regulator
LTVRQRDTRATRQALLAAAADLIAKRGFEGTTVEAIAKQARVNKAMISYHFGGKRGLYGALLAEILTAMAARLDAVRAWDAPPEQRLTAFLAAFREMVRVQPVAPQIMLREAISGGRYLDRKVLPNFLRIFTVLQEILEQGTREGKFRQVSPVLTQVGLVGSLMFFFATEQFRERVVRELGVEAGPMDAEDYIRHWREMMLGGLAVRAAGDDVARVDSRQGQGDK